MKRLMQDVRYGLRVLRKSPAFAAIAVLTLALGIGANTAIFSFVDAWIIKPIPYPQADRLVVLLSHDKKKGWTSNGVSSTADFLDFQKQNISFEQTAAWTSWDFNLTGDGPPALVDGGRVSWNFFDTLGVRPLLGRTFTASDDAAGAPHVAILSEGLWKSRYAQNPKIIGRSINIGDEAYTVVGVMPGRFQFSLLGICNIWTPLALTDKERSDRNRGWFSAFGRLKPGVTQQQAAAETTAIFARLEKQYPQTNTNITGLLSSMAYEIGQNQGNQQVTLCFWIVGLILLIACTNVANLMLARATQRTKEMAVRGALGATRGRLVRQLLTESLLLFLFGGLAGVLFGAWGMSWIESMIPGHIRGYLVNYGEVNLDWMTLTFTLGIALLCGVVFGLAPAFESSGIDLNRALKEASGQASKSGRGARMRRIFVAGEIALAVVVLISTTLLVKSFIISVRSSPGFNPANAMTAQVALPKTKYTSDALTRNFSDAVLARIRALPGVTSAGVASAIPFGGFGQTYTVEAVGKPAPQPGEELGARWTAVSPDYFAAMQMGLLKGRAFTSGDGPGNANVAVIDQTLARQFWSKEDPVGQKLTFGPQHLVCTIVGVVNDVKMYNLRGRPERQMYVPLAQFPSPTLGFVARTAESSPAIATAIRDAIWAVDDQQPVSSVEQLTTLMAIQDSGNRVMMKLMVFFGALALFLGAIGIYGVMAHTVAQRTHEIGIRMALGANPAQVMGMVVRQAMTLTLIGIAIGVAGAFAVTRSLSFMLYEVTTTDASTFVGVAVLFTLVAIAACYVPARRAMRVDPMVALRYE
ncbi:MAG TPA: ABC transporter permease [Candidatus Acidoferrales bacterium]|nr:ABC transporter permease [Candidatus Acidoferrales bacterium]